MTPSPLPSLLPGRRSNLLYRSRLLAILYLLLAPTLVGVLIFTYLPNLEVVKYAFYRWDGSNVEEYRGLANFRQAFTADPIFWNSFKLVGILLIANLAKMWPSILVAIALHRMTSQRSQYVYRVLFVIPMVIPGLVWLLIWKTFFTTGMLNDLLRATGGMSALNAADHALPALASTFQDSAYAWNPEHPLLSTLLQPFRLIPLIFTSSWGLTLFGLAVLAANGGPSTIVRRWPFWLLICGIGAALWGPLRLPLLVGAAIGLGAWLVRDRIDGRIWMRRIGVIAIALGSLLILGTETWTAPIDQFGWKDGNAPDPAWLGNSKLIIPSLILWGFPWVGTIGVLIYLAGLQNISAEVYEAADLDGVGFWGKIFKIELPLIMTQVRINLIFLTIGTLTDYAFYLLLLGPSGGPGGVGQVPGLYMYDKAFIQLDMGYACTLGMCLFVFILALTVFYQKYVRVEK